MDTHYHRCVECGQRYLCHGGCEDGGFFCPECSERLDDLDSDEIYTDWKGRLLE